MKGKNKKLEVTWGFCKKQGFLSPKMWIVSLAWCVMFSKSKKRTLEIIVH